MYIIIVSTWGIKKRHTAETKNMDKSVKTLSIGVINQVSSVYLRKKTSSWDKKYYWKSTGNTTDWWYWNY